MAQYRVGAFLCLAFSIAYGFAAYSIELPEGMPPQVIDAQSYPLILAFIGTLVSLLIIVLPRDEDEQPISLAGDWGKVVTMAGLILAYGLVVGFAGFFLSTFLFLIGGFLLLGEKRIAVLATVPIVFAVLFQILVHGVFGYAMDDPVLQFLGVI